jgi:hypothetical protein
MQANNHAVREAACACMAELCAKVDKAAVAPHVPAMLHALLICFKDDSWPCRDAASTASGRAAAHFPEAAAPFLPELYRLWLELLWDNVPSVRENAAAALGMVAGTVGDDAANRLSEWLQCALIPSWLATCSLLPLVFVCSALFLPELYCLWLEHLWDDMLSVSENAAAALGWVAGAVGDDAM